MIDLSNNWLRRDVATPSVYYGYSNDVSSVDGDRTWAIRKVTTSGTVSTVDTVTWSDSTYLSYTAKWNERVQNFTQPTGPIGITYSKTPDTFSNVFINTSWNYLVGVNKYKISIVDHKGVLYNELSLPFNNVHVTDRYTKFGYFNIFNFYGRTGMTYSISVTGINAGGSTSSVVVVTT